MLGGKRCAGAVGAASPARGSRHASQALVVRAVRAKGPASGTRHVSQSLGASATGDGMGGRPRTLPRRAREAEVLAAEKDENDPGAI